MQRQDLLISFILKGLDVVFSNYPTPLVVLVAVQSSIDSHAIIELYFFNVVGPNLACLELHIVLFGVLQLLLIIHIGQSSLHLISLFES